MIVQADARRIPIRDGCVQCVVTSPPYFGLRDYGLSGQIGLESSPDAYVAQLVAVFREVRRVLKDDGVVWLNLGDSYAGGKTGRDDNSAADRARFDAHGHGGGVKLQATGNNGRARPVPDGLKPKDLIGIPWRVAFALQADGWYLRSDIIWSKKNCMPESVTDRPTKSHEYVFLLTKSERYFYDADALREPLCASTLRQVEQGYNGKATKAYTEARAQDPSAVKSRIIAKLQSAPGRARPESPLGRNARSVWHLATQPYPDAHFATMPEKLAERCILAGSRPGDLVLDPFGGSGTTVRVARRFNRRGVMLDLNLSYLALAEERTSHVQASLLHVQEQTA